MVSDFILSETIEVKDSTFMEMIVQEVALQVPAAAHSQLWLPLKDLVQLLSLLKQLFPQDNHGAHITISLNTLTAIAQELLTFILDQEDPKDPVVKLDLKDQEDPKDVMDPEDPKDLKDLKD